ncbi:MAG: response regulator transcription factor [Actinomycetota bacterium]|nr:response regulator transcription factor [Actinomycetota bacterium]
MAGTALIVEDDPALRQLVRLLLERAGLTVLEAGDGRAALRTFFSAQPDVVVLDVGLPELDGWTVLERIREVSDVPVLMLTAQATELQKVRGLRSGADDYVTKPFGRQELVARVEALLRRARSARKAAEVQDDGFLRIDFGAHRVTAGGNDVSLTPLEFRLLAVLAQNPGNLLTHDRLLELVWNEAAPDARDRVKLYVGYVRRKLERACGDAPIETVRGMGYRYVRRPG